MNSARKFRNSSYIASGGQAACISVRTNKYFFIISREELNMNIFMIFSKAE